MFADLNRPASEWLAGRIAAAGMFQAADVVTDTRHERMTIAEAALGDCQRPNIERTGLIKTARIFVKHTEIVEDRGKFQVSAIPCLLGEGQGLQQAGFGLPVMPVQTMGVPQFPQRSR